MLIQDLMGMGTKKLTEMDAMSEAEAFITVVTSRPEIVTQTWILKDQCRLTLRNRSKDQEAYKTVGLLGGESFFFVGAYIGKVNGVIFQFRPTSEEDRSLLGIAPSDDAVIELSTTQKMPLISPGGRPIKELIVETFGDVDIKELVERAEEEAMRVEREKTLRIAKEKEEVYGTNWGNW